MDRCRRIDEVAEQLTISRSGVYALIARGQLKARKIGGRTVVLESDLGAFMASLPST